MSKTSELTEFTPSLPSPQPSPDRKLNINIPAPLSCERICIITDRTLSDDQIEVLNQRFSVYEIVKSDTSKHISKLPRCDIYVIPLVCNVCYPSKSWGSMFYGRSRRWLKQNGYHIVYYRTLELITSPERLNADYIITEFPESSCSRYDLSEQLLYNSPPRHLGCCGLMLLCLCSKITIGDCFGVICGLSFGL